MLKRILVVLNQIQTLLLEFSLDNILLVRSECHCIMEIQNSTNVMYCFDLHIIHSVSYIVDSVNL